MQALRYEDAKIKMTICARKSYEKNRCEYSPSRVLHDNETVKIVRAVLSISASPLCHTILKHRTRMQFNLSETTEYVSVGSTKIMNYIPSIRDTFAGATLHALHFEINPSWLPFSFHRSTANA